MSAEPWTDVDPQPGEFDEDLAMIDPRYVEHRAGDSNARVRILTSVAFGELLRDADSDAT